MVKPAAMPHPKPKTKTEYKHLAVPKCSKPMRISKTHCNLCNNSFHTPVSKSYRLYKVASFLHLQTFSETAFGLNLSMQSAVYNLSPPPCFVHYALLSNYRQLLIPLSVPLCKELAYMKAEDNISECFRKISKQKWRDANLQMERAISKKGQTPTAFVSKKARQFGKAIGDKQLTDYLNNLWAMLANVDISSNAIREYTFEIIVF